MLSCPGCIRLVDGDLSGTSPSFCGWITMTLLAKLLCPWGLVVGHLINEHVHLAPAWYMAVALRAAIDRKHSEHTRHGQRATCGVQQGASLQTSLLRRALSSQLLFCHFYLPYIPSDPKMT